MIPRDYITEWRTEVLDPWLGIPQWKQPEDRDLFDLATALEEPEVNPDRIIRAFSEYMDHGGNHATRAQFEQNLDAKILV